MYIESIGRDVVDGINPATRKVECDKDTQTKWKDPEEEKRKQKEEEEKKKKEEEEANKKKDQEAEGDQNNKKEGNSMLDVISGTLKGATENRKGLLEEE